jgi:hypothetical protein
VEKNPQGFVGCLLEDTRESHISMMLPPAMDAPAVCPNTFLPLAFVYRVHFRLFAVCFFVSLPSGTFFYRVVPGLSTAKRFVYRVVNILYSANWPLSAKRDYPVEDEISMNGP